MRVGGPDVEASAQDLRVDCWCKLGSTAAVLSFTQRRKEASDGSATADARRFPPPSLLRRLQAHTTDGKHRWAAIRIERHLETGTRAAKLGHVDAERSPVEGQEVGKTGQCGSEADFLLISTVQTHKVTLNAEEKMMKTRLRFWFPNILPVSRL